MNLKQILASLGTVSATLVLGVAMLAPSVALADDNSGTYGGGFDVFDNYDGGYDVFDNYDQPSYYEPSPSYYEPTSASYYEPSSYSYYEPSSYSYYEPSSYSYYEPSSYSYYEPSSYSYYQPSSYNYSYQPYSDTYSNHSNYSPPSYNYDYSYDYVYDYEYTYDYDACSNIPGNQSQGYDCYPDHHTNNDRDVSCNLDASDTRVSDGDRVTLTWDTDGNVTYASINQGIGRVDEDGGSERVDVDGDTTFKMTVRNNQGDEDTCSVTVRVDDNNFSSVSFTGEPTYNPPVVYLSDIPYTGLEDIDPMLLSYWLMLIAAAGAGVWFLYRRGMIPHFAFASVDPIDEGHVVEETEEGHVDASPEVMSFLSALQAGDTDAAVDHLRDAAASGTGVEEFLADAETAATDAELQARVSAALEGAKQTGVKGAKEALA